MSFKLKKLIPRISHIAIVIAIIFFITFTPIASINLGKSTFQTKNAVSKLSEKVRNYWPTTGWLNSTPEEQGMDSKLLKEMMITIETMNYNFESVIIIKNGYIVLEEYPSIQYNQEEPHLLYSVTKSFTSALIGIAIDLGYISSLNEKLIDFFPDRTIANLDSRKQKITLEHLLTMTAGFQWDEWSAPYGDPDNDLTKAWNNASFVQYMLDLPMVSDPGEVWVYNTGVSHLLGAIINQTTGKTPLEFANEHLFEPLGISGVSWRTDREGLNFGGSDLSLTPRDMAKLGFLFLNNGTWNNTQILSTEWITRSTNSSILHSPISGYGYQWWTFPTINAYYAQGYGLQKIIIVPNYDLLVVFTANKRYGFDPQPGLLYHFIVPSIIKNDYISSKASLFDFTVLLIMMVVFITPLISFGAYWVVKTRQMHDIKIETPIKM